MMGPSAPNGPPLPIATADGNGMFRIAGPDGDYLLEIHASGMSRPFKAKIEGGKLSPTEFTVE